MNKKLELFSVGVFSTLFAAFLIFSHGVSLYPIILLVAGIGMLLYGFLKRSELSDFDNPENYDERDEMIQNKVSTIVLSTILYGMMFTLLLNTFIPIPLNYTLVLLIIFTVCAKQLLIKVMEKIYDNQ